LTKPQATKVLPIMGLDFGAIGSMSLFNLRSGGYELGFLLLTSNFKSKPGSGNAISRHRQYPIVICKFKASIVEVLL